MYTEEGRDLPRLVFQILMNLNVERYRGERGEGVSCDDALILHVT